MSSSTPSLKKIVQAGAGAGKTTDLVALFLRETEDFFFKNKQWPKIIVTTFTRKATQELKERIQHKVLETQAELKSKYMSDPHDETLRARLVFYEEVFDFVNKKSFVQISTIHGILNLFLKAVAPQIDLSSDYTFVGSEESFSSAQKILKKSFLQESDFLDLLESYDFRTLTKIFIGLFEHWMCLGVVKGAKGKDLIASEKAEIQKALKEGLSIVRSILAETTHASWISYLQGIEGAAHLILNQSGNPHELQLEELIEALSVRKPPFSAKKEPFSFILDEQFVLWRDSIKKRAQSIADWSVAFFDYESIIEKTERLAVRFCEEFLNHKLSTGQLTMSDLEILAAYALRINPELGVSFSKSWNFWMIDEFQDTSPIQDSILESLIQGAKSYYVGDPQQSIYLFRGARSEVFFNKVQKITAGGGSFSQKLINYRSHHEVLSFVNSVFTRLDSQMFSRMDLGKSGENSRAETTTIWQVPEQGSSSLAVANRVMELLGKGYSADSIAVLMRTNKQIQEISLAFKEAQIPFQVHGSGLFYSRREIQDLLLIIKFIMNSKDDLNFLSLCRSPWIRITDQELIDLCRQAKGPLINQVQGAEALGFQQLRQLLDSSEKFGLLFALRNFLTESGFLLSSLVYDGTGRREANIWKFLTLLENEMRRPGFSLLQFVIDANLAASGELENEDGDAAPVISPNRVNVMTIHSSKGLQFEHVIVPFLEKKQKSFNSKDLMIEEATGVFTLKVPHPDGESPLESPLSLQIKEEIRSRESKEELRTFYVACTRSISSLTLVVSAKCEKESLGELLPLNIVEGNHTLDQGNYRVRVDLPEPVQVKNQSVQQTSVRKVYQQDFQSESQFAITKQKSFSFEPSVAGIMRSVVGTQFHHIMESLKYSTVSEVLQSLDFQMAAGVTYLLEQAEVPLLKIIQNGETEFGFSFQELAQRYSGQIDLWGSDGQDIWIIDYKTGQSKYQKEAFEQLQFYHYGLVKTEEIKSEQVVHLAVLYPNEKKIFTQKIQFSQSQNFFKGLTSRNP